MHLQVKFIEVRIPTPMDRSGRPVNLAPFPGMKELLASGHIHTYMTPYKKEHGPGYEGGCQHLFINIDMPPAKMPIPYLRQLLTDLSSDPIKLQDEFIAHSETITTLLNCFILDPRKPFDKDSTIKFAVKIWQEELHDPDALPDDRLLHDLRMVDSTITYGDACDLVSRHRQFEF